MTTAERLEDLVIKMLTISELSVYGNLLARTVFKEESNIPTLGVHIVNRSIELVYNSSFIEQQNDKQLTFLLLHEMFHIMLKHIERETNVSNHEIANIAEDMLINEAIMNSTLFQNHIDLPRENGRFSGVCKESVQDMTGEKYKDLETFEAAYMWLKSRIPQDQINQAVQQIGNGNIKVGFDCHIPDQAADEDIDIISEDAYDMAKSRGTLPGKLEQMKQALLNKKPDYLKIIKKIVSNYLMHGMKFKTFTRPHIYGIEGLKGHTYREYQINCILDTSGSMCNEFEKVLAYLYKNKVIITLIQIDTEIQSISTITNTKDIQNIKISGYGGTVLQPALDYISKSKLNNYCNLILTDGYTDRLNFKNIRKNTLILSTDVKCNVTKKSANKVKQIIIK